MGAAFSRPDLSNNPDVLIGPVQVPLRSLLLKVLSSEMNLAEIGSFDRSSLKREAQMFLEKFARPPSSESP